MNYQGANLIDQQESEERRIIMTANDDGEDDFSDEFSEIDEVLRPN